jgi:hypothetical protein
MTIGGLIALYNHYIERIRPKTPKTAGRTDLMALLPQRARIASGGGHHRLIRSALGPSINPVAHVNAMQLKRKFHVN